MFKEKAKIIFRNKKAPAHSVLYLDVLNACFFSWPEPKQLTYKHCLFGKVQEQENRYTFWKELILILVKVCNLLQFITSSFLSMQPLKQGKGYKKTRKSSFTSSYTMIRNSNAAAECHPKAGRLGETLRCSLDLTPCDFWPG